MVNIALKGKLLERDISQIQVAPAGSFDTERHSIGSTNDASVFGKQSRRARNSLCISFLRKTDAS